jgi:pyruvate,orthophosphate dikinase
LIGTGGRVFWPKGIAAVQKLVEIPDFLVLDPVAPVTVASHGGRAKCLQRLIRLDMPVPKTVALSFKTVRAISVGEVVDSESILVNFGDRPLVSVRPSSEDPDWGGPGAVLNIGMNDARYVELCDKIGKPAAAALYLRFVQAYADAGVEHPVLMPMPWGEDRFGVTSATMRAAINGLAGR